jgi:hypothetical protein
MKVPGIKSLISSGIFSYLSTLILIQIAMVTIEQIKDLTERTGDLGRYL